MIFEHLFIGLPSNGYENSSFSTVYHARKSAKNSQSFSSFILKLGLIMKTVQILILIILALFARTETIKKAEELECIYQMI
jgi:hypothetical protein